MNFLECVSNRRSVRKFKPTEVSDDQIKKLIQIASYSPSWKNTQTVRYVAIKDDHLKSRLADECVADFAGNQKVIHSAPAVMILKTITGRSGFERDGSYSTEKQTHWESFDAGIAAQTLCLAAHDEGLATVIMGIYDESKVKALLDLPDTEKVAAIIAVGYPDEAPNMPKRKPVEDLLIFR